MIELTMPQGSKEWHDARLGLPTASNFGRILTEKGLKASASSNKFLCEKLAERIMGFPLETFEGSGETMRGSAMESAAVRWYEFQHDVPTRKSGICLTDDRRAGCSVDRFVGEDGILEIKCPMPVQHLMTVLGYDDAEHRLQIQGQLWITGRRWVDRLSYYAEMPQDCTRFERDEVAINHIDEEVMAFCDRLDDAERRVRAMMVGGPDAGNKRFVVGGAEVQIPPGNYDSAGLAAEVAKVSGGAITADDGVALNSARHNLRDAVANVERRQKRILVQFSGGIPWLVDSDALSRIGRAQSYNLDTATLGELQTLTEFVDSVSKGGKSR
jgi:hypothetical protein